SASMPTSKTPSLDPSQSSDATPSVDRRRFLAGVGVAGAAVGIGAPADAQQAAKVPAVPAAPERGALPVLRAAAEVAPDPSDQLTTDLRSGADFMVDVMKALNIDYVAGMCASSYRGLHESIIDYGMNKKPEFLTCTHEETAVAICHGYYKAAFKPMAATVHAVVGLQHASMAVYNAFVDRVPLLLFVGNSLDENLRRPGVEWRHSEEDGAALTRDFTKWDDQPVSFQHFADSTVRAYQVATAVPSAPVVIVADSGLQEQLIEPADEKKIYIPKLAPDMPPQADSNGLRDIAKMLVAADNPVIIADRYARTADGMQLLVQLAELLQAPVVDLGGRANMPNTHYLAQARRKGALVNSADVILALEMQDPWSINHDIRDQLERTPINSGKPNVKIVSISSHNLLIKANVQDSERYAALDLSLAGDAQASMPTLIDAVQQAMTADRKSAIAARASKLQAAYKTMRDQTLEDAAGGWDDQPISTARVSMELWDLIKNDDWAFGGEGMGWERALWKLDKPWHSHGSSGGSGVGYNLPASVGAALANRDQGRYTVAFQRDGDSMFVPGALWTAAHHKIPLLSIVHNNGGWHQELMHIQRVAYRHKRGFDRFGIGTTLRDPPVDFGMLARSMGVHGEGPIRDPKDLRPAMIRALDVVKSGEPALVDVIMQPR
ncbi:MAG TPA: thiamine pyrophosphate-dependent enzyme, partial [Beijerinckiaceae bacterium]|nr:thiamine pyrophosphate-dependent enzyme [Beijerinckiaceae bacterium]